ncbi:probable ATP-dependent RNA helicase DDX27 [Coccinella septempunctata]|uniref:probable ATP-dependent RNA helicase DDX27 n=1 Tax=Coccinella septempunctata TaxID=41139 RepID=UPI001D096A43|nr:probable ATP-dependent RNA helicase DDX27 [Coccinella septempunctata]
MRIIKTIDDNEEVEDFSEDSEAEVDYQPKLGRNKNAGDFDTNFSFVASIEEYNKDPWNDLSKYIKRKAKTKTDDKIKKARLDNIIEENSDVEENDSGSELSEDELQHDRIKVVEKKRKKKKVDDNFFETVEKNIDEYTSFQQMNLSRPLLKAITDMRFIHPTPIQVSAIPVALLGRDICGCAATGTGKTAAYMLPTLERLLYRPSGSAVVIRVLVLVPTRELGVQVYQVSKQLCQYTDIQIGLAVGGLDLKVQENILRKNPDVVIATPGRLIDHLKSTPTFSLDSIEVLILDEADRILDEYFSEQMNEIIKQCSRTRQTMLFSATMTEEVEKLAAVSLNKPVRLFVDSNTQVAFNLRQEFVKIRSDKEGDREPILAALVCRIFREHTMIFVQTKKQAHRLHLLLGLLGVKVAELHGNLTQPQRLDALDRFKNKEVDILVATDVAARGLDIKGVKTVINFVMPATLEHYIHRVGRTARAGRAGISVSLAGEQERKMVKEIVKRANNTLKSRVIPPDILEKYREKLEKIEPQINKILKEEYEERMLSKVENRANRAEKILKGEVDPNRPWFQTKKERQKEKERLSLKPTDGAKPKPENKGKNTENKKNNKKKGKDTAEDRANNEMKKVALLQAKLAKRKSKPGKIIAVKDAELNGKTSGKKKQSSFFKDLTDTSNKNAKKLRYDANFKKKMDGKMKKKGGGGGDKKRNSNFKKKSKF